MRERVLSAASGDRPRGRSPYLWVVLYLVAIGIVGTLKLTDAINGPTGFILLALATGLLIPIARQRTAGCASKAMVDYNRRVLVSSFGYALGLGIAVTLWDNYELSRPVVFAISLLPTLPTFGVIWAMARYLAEEQDEYLRHRTIMAALIALGLVLALGIFWGFLEMFELVPHVWAWWVLPVWAIGLGFAQLWQKVRDA
ncbi:hypothetical protein [Qipengyuania pacifica]|uniref:hypothetical protein n=2 Tax=Qipengyuania pacifica TaxID=2860199 RepID=UPI0031E7E299